MRAALPVVVALLLTSAPAQAQPVAGQQPQAAATVQTPVSRSRLPVQFRAYLFFESASLAAAETFEAVVGTSRLSMTGGGGELLNLWKGLFARVTFSSVETTGSRVALFDDEVIALGIPLTVGLRPLEVAGGWRFTALASGRVVPYAGGGLLRMGYRESSEFGTGDDNTNDTFSGAVVFGGLEATVFRWAFAGAEVQYRTVPGALGDGGVSEVFGETDLGGVAVRVLVGIRR